MSKAGKRLIEAAQQAVDGLVVRTSGNDARDELMRLERICSCMGPQDGAPMCPCRMTAAWNHFARELERLAPGKSWVGVQRKQARNAC